MCARTGIFVSEQGVPFFGNKFGVNPPFAFSTLTLLPMYNVQSVRHETNCTLFLLREMKQLTSERQ